MPRIRWLTLWWRASSFASVVCAIGLGSVAGVSRVFNVAAIRVRSGVHLLVLAALITIVCADMSMLSKAETERIWQPFMPLVLLAGAALPAQRLMADRRWLGLQVAVALGLQLTLRSPW